MIAFPEIKLKLLQQCVKEILSNTQQKFAELKSDPIVAYAEWRDVEKLASTKSLGEAASERKSKGSELMSSLRDSLHGIKKSEMAD
jgi:hypothetical protein